MDTETVKITKGDFVLYFVLGLMLGVWLVSMMVK